MVEPTSPNKNLILPNTGDLSGSWGSAALNPNATAIDGMLGGFVTVGLSSSNVTLSGPSGTASPSSGPNQSQNAFITFTGTLSGNVVVTFPLPGFYIINNQCTVGSFYVQVAAANTGNVIAMPPGEIHKIFCDGANMYFMDLPHIGSYLDLAVATVPPWINGCTLPPYLECQGGSFSSVTFPFLYAVLGNSTTLPDARGRARYMLNLGTGRINLQSNVGIDGNTLLAGGGSQLLGQSSLPDVQFENSGITIQGNGNTFNTWSNQANPGPGNVAVLSVGQVNSVLAGAAFSFSMGVSNQGSAASGGSGLPALPPGYVGGITLIRAG